MPCSNKAHLRKQELNWPEQANFLIPFFRPKKTHCARQQQITVNDGETMAFEKAKKLNYVVMGSGFAVAAAGVAVYLHGTELAGVLLSIAGVSLLIVTFTVSNLFFKIKMMEMHENRKMNEK
jgi:hypothetical protein